MRTYLECVPCFLRQTLEAARFATSDCGVHERVLRDVLRSAAEMDLSRPPPVVGQMIHRRLRELTGVADPYRGVKERLNRVALEMLAGLVERVRSAKDPLLVAARLAIAGNALDSGVDAGLTEEKARRAVATALSDPFCGDMENFAQAAASARSILYLADNAGEIVFDRLLIQRLPAGRVTVVVRGGPVINDATMDDARVAGLDEVAEVIDNGSDAPGTLLEDCSDEFRRRFEQADMVIAKGQGNFESLSDEPGNLFFLLKVKCPVIASRLGRSVGTDVLRCSRAPLPVSEEG